MSETKTPDEPSVNIQQRLNEIQQALKAPKGNKNDFGGYRYRSCEDILEAVKPLLGGCVLTLSDEVQQIGERYYVKATATLACGNVATLTTAYAREAESRKGMDESQITGSASSYARKYALNGLFAIDDTRDADTQDNREVGTKSSPAKAAVSNMHATCVVCGKEIRGSAKYSVDELVAMSMRDYGEVRCYQHGKGAKNG